MNRKNYPFNLNLTILIFLVTFFTFHSEQEANQLNENPLDFTLKTLNGEEICLKNYRGEKIVHLLFWATWCPHCLMEMPKIKKLHNLVGNKPYEILAIDVGLNDSPKRIRKVNDQYEMPCKILLDRNAKILKGCRIFGVPYHIIIDKEGIIIDRFNTLPDDLTKYLNKFFPPKSCE